MDVSDGHALTPDGPTTSARTPTSEASLRPNRAGRSERTRIQMSSGQRRARLRWAYSESSAETSASAMCLRRESSSTISNSARSLLALGERPTSDSRAFSGETVLVESHDDSSFASGRLGVIAVRAERSAHPSLQLRAKKRHRNTMDLPREPRGPASVRSGRDPAALRARASRASRGALLPGPLAPIGAENSVATVESLSCESSDRTTFFIEPLSAAPTRAAAPSEQNDGRRSAEAPTRAAARPAPA